VEIVQTTSVNDFSKAATLTVFPNPFIEQLSVELNLPESQTHASLEVINAVGQIIEKRSLGKLLPGLQTLTLDTKNLSAGLYFIRYQNEEGTVLVKKVIKRG